MLTTATVHGLDVPGPMTLVWIRHEKRNTRPVVVKRYQPAQHPVPLLGGPHVTCIVDLLNGQLLGMTQMVESVASGPVPTSAPAQQRAEAYLARIAPDLVNQLHLVEITPCTDVLAVDGYDIGVIGQRVSYRDPSTEQFTLVTVGPNQRVITFERDIVWDHAHCRRHTQMWLHDPWIAAHDGSGPQPGPPVALTHTDEVTI